MSVKTLAATLKAKYAAAIDAVTAYLEQLKKDASTLSQVSADRDRLFDDVEDAHDDIATAATALNAGYPTVTVGSLIYDIVLPEAVVDRAVVTAETIDGLGNDSALATSMVAGNSNMMRIHKPTAEFSADDTSVAPTQEINFSDESTNAPDTWAWDFGDGETSDQQNPAHAYAEAGTYTVILVASNAGGSNTKTRTNYITIT